jgi:hypothetical protein
MGEDPTIGISRYPLTNIMRKVHCKWAAILSWFHSHIWSYACVPQPFFVVQLPLRLHLWAWSWCLFFCGRSISLHWIRIVFLRVSILKTILLWLQSQCFLRHTQTPIEFCISVDEIMDPAIIWNTCPCCPTQMNWYYTWPGVSVFFLRRLILGATIVEYSFFADEIRICILQHGWSWFASGLCSNIVGKRIDEYRHLNKLIWEAIGRSIVNQAFMVIWWYPWLYLWLYRWSIYIQWFLKIFHRYTMVYLCLL